MVMLPMMTAANALNALNAVLLRMDLAIIKQNIGQLPQYYRCPPFCPAGTGCTAEIAYYRGYARYGCCAPGEILCAGVCRQACPGNQRMEGVNCTCGCVGGDPGCLNGMVWDPVNCRCSCPATPCPDARMTRDAFCVCKCPDPYTDCGGYCVDLTDDDSVFCGACGVICDPFTEKCCQGKCVNICTNTDCGDCGRQIQAGEKCCNCRPRTLGTNTDCSDCGVKCTGGKVCINKSCQCPSGTTAVGSCCCPAGQGCCPCKPLNTSLNCGACGATCNYYQSGTNNFMGTGSCDSVTLRCHCPPNTTKAGMSARGDDICCPNQTPNLGSDGMCHP